MVSCENCEVKDAETVRIRELVVQGYQLSSDMVGKVLSADQIDNLARCLLAKKAGNCMLDNISTALDSLQDESHISDERRDD
jgi:hypothetical protein